jgi:hypothetical protein
MLLPNCGQSDAEVIALPPKDEGVVHRGSSCRGGPTFGDLLNNGVSE